MWTADREDASSGPTFVSCVDCHPMMRRAISARPCSQGQSTAVLTDVHITEGRVPYGFVTFWANKELFARTGQQHTLNVTRIRVDKNWGVYIPGPALAINDAGHLNAESSFFGDNRAIGFYLAGAGGSLRTSTRPTLNR